MINFGLLLLSNAYLFYVVHVVINDFYFFIEASFLGSNPNRKIKH
jgi:hypothetical protein